MSKTKRLKKVYYLPGIISLIAVPLLFAYYTEQLVRHYSLTVIPIYWADIELTKSHPELFKSFRGHFPPLREYVDVELNGDEVRDRFNLGFAQMTARKYIATEDTLHGVHFVFGNKATYGSFANAVDLLRLEGSKTYMPTENHLWFYILPPVREDTTEDLAAIYCGTQYKQTKKNQSIGKKYNPKP